MIITRTPYRISFFGGGSDYPEWYLKHGGQVLSTSINKYCYITLRYLPPFFEHKLRLVYGKIEECRHYSELMHPAAREILRFLECNENLEIHHDGDLPARSGMGSSSSFCVGLFNAFYCMKNVSISKEELAVLSIYIERQMLRETVGSQDQCAASFGGLNHICFHKNKVDVCPVVIPTERKTLFNDHLMLFYSRIRRTASEIAQTYINKKTCDNTLIEEMEALVEEGLKLLQSQNDFLEFGKLLHQGWQMKRKLSSKISNSFLDDAYERALKTGAIGGKVLGAGGGGFLLLFVPPEKQENVKTELSKLLYTPFRFEDQGTKLIYSSKKMETFGKIPYSHDNSRLRSFGSLHDEIQKEFENTTSSENIAQALVL